jgi:hypothetical protein
MKGMVAAKALATVVVGSLCLMLLDKGVRARFRLALPTPAEQPACLLFGPEESLPGALLDHMVLWRLCDVMHYVEISTVSAKGPAQHAEAVR